VLGTSAPSAGASGGHFSSVTTVPKHSHGINTVQAQSGTTTAHWHYYLAATSTTSAGS